jgi:dTDP-4-amino-4,6-dideoxygalactose transaminase
MFVIEDCASAMGADLDGVMTGEFGDYAVFSFGYAKTMDLGYGGLVASNRPLDRVAEMNERLDCYDDHTQADSIFLSQLYRVLRNNAGSLSVKRIYDVIPEYFRHCFLFRAAPSHCREIQARVSDLDSIILRRREQARLYESGFSGNPHIETYAFAPGAVPWRYNILVPESCRPALIRELLRQQIPVSDWYPVVAPMFGVEGSFPRAEAMERRILNFPLLSVDTDQILRITEAVNHFCCDGINSQTTDQAGAKAGSLTCREKGRQDGAV